MSLLPKYIAQNPDKFKYLPHLEEEGIGLDAVSSKYQIFSELLLYARHCHFENNDEQIKISFFTFCL